MKDAIKALVDEIGDILHLITLDDEADVELIQDYLFEDSMIVWYTDYQQNDRCWLVPYSRIISLSEIEAEEVK